MAKLKPEDNARAYDPSEHEPPPKNFKPNRFYLRKIVAPEDTQISTTLDLYFDEHTHRTPEFMDQVEKNIVDFLETNGLEPRDKVRLITKPMCRRWKEKMLASGIGASTIQRRYGILNHWLKWCWRQEFIESVPSDGLQLPARTVAESRKRRTSFTPDELKALLNDPAFRSMAFARTFRGKQYAPRPLDIEHFWCVMMLAYSGARAGEVVKLLRSNIQQEKGSGIWYMDLEFDAENNKRLKNRQSIRRVPLHSALLKMGLLDFVNAGTSKWLFPATMDKGQPSAAISAKFKYLRDAREPGGTADRSKTLHSLRHTMAVMLKKARVDDGIRHKLLGHAQGSSVEDRIYLEGLSYELHELSAGLESVTLPVDLEWKSPQD